MRSASAWIAAWTRCGGRISTSGTRPASMSACSRTTSTSITDPPKSTAARAPGAVNDEYGLSPLARERRPTTCSTTDAAPAGFAGTRCPCSSRWDLRLPRLARVLVKSLSALVTRARRARSGSWCGPGEAGLPARPPPSASASPGPSAGVARSPPAARRPRGRPPRPCRRPLARPGPSPAESAAGVGEPPGRTGRRGRGVSTRQPSALSGRAHVRRGSRGGRPPMSGSAGARRGFERARGRAGIGPQRRRRSARLRTVERRPVHVCRTTHLRRGADRAGRPRCADDGTARTRGRRHQHGGQQMAERPRRVGAPAGPDEPRHLPQRMHDVVGGVRQRCRRVRDDAAGMVEVVGVGGIRDADEADDVLHTLADTLDDAPELVAARPHPVACLGDPAGASRGRLGRHRGRREDRTRGGVGGPVAAAARVHEQPPRRRQLGLRAPRWASPRHPAPRGNAPPRRPPAPAPRPARSRTAPRPARRTGRRPTPATTGPAPRRTAPGTPRPRRRSTRPPRSPPARGRWSRTRRRAR